MAGVGCGEERVKVYPVSGRVMFRGAPAAGAAVVFHDRRPHEELRQLPIPKAQVAADGSFQLASFVDGDGAPAGEYDVTVIWPAGVAGPTEDPESVVGDLDQLQGRYADPDTSGLHATVVEGENTLDPFELQ